MSGKIYNLIDAIEHHEEGGDMYRREGAGHECDLLIDVRDGTVRQMTSSLGADRGRVGPGLAIWRRHARQIGDCPCSALSMESRDDALP